MAAEGRRFRAHVALSSTNRLPTCWRAIYSGWPFHLAAFAGLGDRKVFAVLAFVAEHGLVRPAALPKGLELGIGELGPSDPVNAEGEPPSYPFLLSIRHSFRLLPR